MIALFTRWHIARSAARIGSLGGKKRAANERDKRLSLARQMRVECGLAPDPRLE